MAAARSIEPNPLPEDKAHEPLVSTLDDAGFAELVECFVGEMPAKIETLQRCLRESDFAQLASLAHQLKGSAGGYGFQPITQSAAVLEKTAKQADDLEKLNEQLNDLVDLCRRAVPAKH